MSSRKGPTKQMKRLSQYFEKQEDWEGSLVDRVANAAGISRRTYFRVMKDRQNTGTACMGITTDTVTEVEDL